MNARSPLRQSPGSRGADGVAGGPGGAGRDRVLGAAIRTAPGMDSPGPVTQPAQRVVMSESIFRRCINQDRRLPFINDRISRYPKRVRALQAHSGR